MAKGTTVYARAMHYKRLEEKRKERTKGNRLVVQGAAGAKCGAKRRDGNSCRNAAGQGTSHFGIGHCKYHGGNLPSHNRSAAKKQAVFLGAPKEINPLDAIIWCIKMTAGEIDFYTEQIALLEKKDWLEDTVMGRQLHIFARMRGEAQDRLVKYSKDAVSLGLTERAVRLAEQYGTTLARLLKGVLDDLMPYISAEGQKKIPETIRKHLMLAEAAASVDGRKAVRELTA